ncbi:uncharacterized protein LOC126699423 isoform X2 [Quercus robur]|uniref:uncharacterized protein LOC126699423 isoform X2 n=1 Tax=Quercus robur TaxID=38942 RepID=UPI002163084F|nr:uncharacterized protein LOC126699423 isoform X2 [Quercus robur]XP_050253212.1 uncharacterized protein LOC126699423 isoform X2 [Quercus robur]
MMMMTQSVMNTARLNGIVCQPQGFWEGLRQYMSQFGELENVMVMKIAQQNVLVDLALSHLALQKILRKCLYLNISIMEGHLRFKLLPKDGSFLCLASSVSKIRCSRNLEMVLIIQ